MPACAAAFCAAVLLCFGCGSAYAATITLNPDNYNQGFQPVAGAGLFAASSSALSGSGSVTPLYTAITYEYDFARQAAVYLPGSAEPMLDVATAVHLQLTSNPYGQVPRYARSADASASVLNYTLLVDDSQVATGTPVTLAVEYRSFTEVVGAGNAAVSFSLRRLSGGTIVGATQIQIGDFAQPAHLDSDGQIVAASVGTNRNGSVGAFGADGQWVETHFTPGDGGRLQVLARAGEVLSLNLYAGAAALATYDGAAGVAIDNAQASAILDPFISVVASDPNAGVVRILNVLSGAEYTRMDWGGYLPQLAPVPEPASGLLWLAGFATLLARRPVARGTCG
jgi:hypothetical protein